MNDDFLSPLRQIQKVETPPFLLTRIEARIEASQTQYLSLRWVWSLSLCFVLILGLNALVLLKNTDSNQSNISQSLQQDLLPNNSLYHE